MKMKALSAQNTDLRKSFDLVEVERPVPKDNEVLIKVHATTCHIGDVRIRGFKVPFWQMIPFRLYLGISKTKEGDTRHGISRGD